MAQVAGAYPEGKEDDKAEGHLGARNGGSFEGHLGSWIFLFFIFYDKLLYTFELGRTRLDFFFSSF